MRSKNRLFTKKFWQILEFKNYALFLTAVFFTFASIGFVSDILENLQYTYSAMIISVLFTGAISTGYAYAATKRIYLMPALIIIQVVYIFFLRSKEMAAFTHEEMDTKFDVVAIGILLCITLGYVFFTLFITRVGIKHFVMKAEMDLAKSIHEVIVPVVDERSERFEIYGKSVPTSEVGGDLIDLTKGEFSVLCTVADVSGHGVSSGVYMGMFKSSFRALFKTTDNLGKLIFETNNTLVPLIKKSMFITTAMIKFNTNNEADFTVAGHLPILQYNSVKNEVKELLIKQIPIGFKLDFNFVSEKVEFNRGDIFALVTDGITETKDSKQNEFGIDIIKSIIVENKNKAAKEIFESIFEKTTAHGKQFDDQTLLIVKCL
ncbi:MAG: serine/threonine-protein phosphatase [Melioribacteraceae bacterium]|nr:serine/threonine-protein phosphatase [Melioribacteraceae bacterium]MCF8395778.1 serine/threonine-protein phosphatase [Melioribacteraceae bacterium]MCF8420907.1 serine/threonine-protein phosphatase [Melioribacteraceae bacterium]